MPQAAPVIVSALVLKTQPSGEKYVQAALLGKERGLIRCMIRKRSKPPHLLVDLFDQGEAAIDLKPEGSSGFLKDFHIERKRAGIGRDYRRLQAASRLSNFVLANPIHEENVALIFALVEKALDSLEQGMPTAAVLLKTFYVYSRDEGYPMAEDWARRLPSDLASIVANVLNTPLAQLEVDAASQERALEALVAYLRHETHVYVE